MTESNSEKEKVLVLLTEFFPAANKDIFLKHDYTLLASSYKHVHVFPITDSSNQHPDLPENMIIHKPLAKMTHHQGMWNMTNSLLLAKLLLSEIRYTTNKLAVLKNARYHLAEIKSAIRLESALHFWTKKYKTTSLTFHASFMNIHALVLAIAKYKKHIKQYSFRINGYEIFNERWVDGYLPYEHFIYQQAKIIIVNSNHSYNYKTSYCPFPEKLAMSYYSIPKQELAPFDPHSIFTIVSCASVIPIKRVHLIAEAVTKLPFETKWIHFGDGENMPEIKEIMTKSPQHINIELKGTTDNTDIISFYKSNTVHLFVHTSESEGLCYALMEAQSFGIPTLACGAGGINDFVSDSNGRLLPINIDATILAQEINNFKLSSKNRYEFRLKLQKAFNTKFDNNEIKKKLSDQINS